MGEDGGGVMSSPAKIPEFGQQIEGQYYAPRPGAYGLIFDASGRIAILETQSGCYLPGGGTEGSETPEETLVREVWEECGFSVEIIERVGEAAEYRFTAGHEFGVRKECVFFEATVGDGGGAATEADHALIWLEPHEAEKRLSHGSERWALRQHLRV